MPGPGVPAPPPALPSLLCPGIKSLMAWSLHLSLGCRESCIPGGRRVVQTWSAQPGLLGAELSEVPRGKHESDCALRTQGLWAICSSCQLHDYRVTSPSSLSCPPGGGIGVHTGGLHLLNGWLCGFSPEMTADVPGLSWSTGVDTMPFHRESQLSQLWVSGQ